MEKSALHKGATAHGVKPAPRPAREPGHFPPDEGFLPPHKGWHPLSSHHQSTARADWRCGDAGLVARQTRLPDCAVAGFGSIRPVLGQPLAASMLRGKDASFILLA